MPTAKLILAGTFSALLTAGVGFLTQFGLTVAVGIVLAAGMALFLVPGLTGLIGRAAWWPGIRRARRHQSDEVHRSHGGTGVKALAREDVAQEP